MIVSVTIRYQNGKTTEVQEIKGGKTMRDLNHILQLVAAASVYDPGETDLDDEQSVSSITGLTLGDVRLARRLTR
jgi:hypothetical protein